MKRSYYLGLSKWILAMGIIFWIGETAYFGWNLRAMSEFEKYCDNVVSFIIAIGLIVMLIPGLKEYEKWMKED